jgi:FkbM family methyltransferase
LPEIVKNGIRLKHREHAGDEAVIQEVFDEDVYRVHDIKKGNVVIDIGAHIGTFTLRCCIERDCIVYAYEPNPYSYELLVENVRLNHVENKVKMFNCAVGKSCGKRRFHVYNIQQAASFSILEGYESDKQITVDCIDPKLLFQANNLFSCNLLKIDAELAEQEIFTDEFSPYLAKAKRIILEWHYYDGHIYRDYLKNLGFIVLLTGCGVPVPPYDPTFARGMLYAKKIEA